MPCRDLPGRAAVETMAVDAIEILSVIRRGRGRNTRREQRAAEKLSQ